MTEWVLLGVVVLLIAANALFVAAEFALVTVVGPPELSGHAGGTEETAERELHE